MRTLMILTAVLVTIALSVASAEPTVCVSDGDYRCANNGVACADVLDLTHSGCDGIVCVSAGSFVHDSIGAHTGQC